MNKKLTHIDLFGDPQENFHILGKRDKDAFDELYNQLSMLCIKNNVLAESLKIAHEIISKIDKNKRSSVNPNLKAYAEGMNKKYEDVMFTMLMPEIVASFNKWIPDLLSIIPGCSSLFVWDSLTNGVIHSRILDYAISGPFEKNERSILYELPNSYKVLSYGSGGVPLASLSAMNEKGLTMALHYKHSKFFNKNGESIFIITNEIISTCSNIKEVKKLLSTKQSIGHWGINFSDSNGDILSIDIKGQDIHHEKFEARDHKYLYFNNRPILKNSKDEELQPFGNLNQCLMRKDYIRRNFDKIIKTTVDNKNLMSETIKLLTSPNFMKMKTAKNWLFKPTTPSSVQCCSFNSKLLCSSSIIGSSPKFYSDTIVSYQDIFKNLVVSKKVTNRKENSQVSAYKYLSEYQSALDKGDVSRAYHKIQMAIELQKGYPEFYISKFYFIITQYVYEADKRDYTYLYEELESLENKLPKYLEDQRLLFLMRLGKIIGHKVKNTSNLIDNSGLKKLYLREYSQNSITIKALQKLIYPRIEILDILYLY